VFEVLCGVQCLENTPASGYKNSLNQLNMQEDQKMCERRNLRFFLSASIFFVMAVSSISAAGDIIYVKEDGTGSGTSWGDAYGDLQDALDAAIFGYEIWVAEGTYRPNPNGLVNPREASFRMINDVAIYGGFAGTETYLDERDPNRHVTILSGDLLGNDDSTTALDELLNDPNRADNCYHVFYHPNGSNLNTTAILDGFTITAGNANVFLHEFGGGICISDSNPTIRKCIILRNSADHGGGMCTWDSKPTMTNCTFTDNWADYRGGGMYNGFSSDIILNNCIFSGNTAIGGGGMYNSDSDPIVTNCTFISNSANHGGGMENDSLELISDPIVINCTFIKNTAASGGGMNNEHNSSPIVINCTFTGNTASGIGGGGGMRNSGRSKLTASNCIFSNNSANKGGGVNNNNNSSLTFTNCTFADNSAVNGNGLAFDSYNQSRPSDIEMSNCILWDGGGEIWNNDGSTITISYSDVQGGWPGEGNINVDPLFVEPGYWDDNGTVMDPNDDFWVDGDYHLLATSPCIDAGDPNYSAPDNPTDIEGRARIVDGDGNGEVVVDMGAYEYRLSVIYVDAGGAGDFITIQAGIDAANPGFMVIVADGTYTGDGNRDIDFDGKAITVRSENGPENCIIDCQGDPNEPHRGFIFQNGEDANSVLDGFTITNGYAPMEEITVWEGEPVYYTVYASFGGGIFCNSSSPTIANCIIRDNFSLQIGGGGIFCYSAIPVLINCEFVDNTTQDGGGMYNWYSSPTVTSCTFIGNYYRGMYNYEYSNPTVTNCTFSGNYGGGMENEYFSNPIVTGCTFTVNSNWDGGGMYNKESSPIVTNCTFTGNSATYDGGGMCNYWYSNPTVTNCTFSGNSADHHGGGMYNGNSSPKMTSCNFSGNSAYNDGGGMCNWGSSPTVIPPVSNCTFAGNTAENGNGLAFDSFNQSWPSDIEMINCILWDGGGEIWNNDGSTITISYSDVQGGWLGVGNIDVDPLFVDPGYWDDNGTATDPNDDFWVDGDYHLGLNSACINAGDPAGDYSGMVDMDGEGRVRNGRVDMGADEGFIVFGDFEPDWDVDLADVAVFVSHWCEMDCAESNWCGGSDFNRSGSTDFTDFAILSENWQLAIPVGHWQMNDNASNAVVLDNSGKGNDGIAQQNTNQMAVTGVIDGALAFDGVGDYVQIADSDPLSPTQEITVCGWFYFDNVNENVGLVWKDSYNYALYTPANTIRFSAWNSLSEESRASFSTSLLGAGWNFIAGVFDGANSRLYLDGAAIGNIGASLTGGIRDRVGDLYIGQRPDGVGEEYFDGLIDEVKIYGKALSVTEIGNLYDEGGY